MRTFLTYTLAAQALLEQLIHSCRANQNCVAVYLHVLTTNLPGKFHFALFLARPPFHITVSFFFLLYTTAIRFYEKNNFVRLRHLDSYYIIDGQWHDAYLYALYMNGGKPPAFSLKEYAYVWFVCGRVVQYPYEGHLKHESLA